MPPASPDQLPTHAGVDVLVPTHRPRYLRLVLAALADQTLTPRRILISADVDDPSIGEIARWAHEHLGLRTSWIRRAHHGTERLCQVRNNAVRHLTTTLNTSTGRLVVLDGDMIAPPRTLELHARLGATADLIYPYRIDLSEHESAELESRADRGDATKAVRDACASHPTPDELATLKARHARYRKQHILRRLRLGPEHKPKLLGGHFSIDIAWYAKLNGFDELYQGWGFKDDEFAYRAARLGARLRVAVADIPALHLYHITRQAPGRMADLPTAKRFASRKELPLFARHGIENPLPQHEIRTSDFPPISQ